MSKMLRRLRTTSQSHELASNVTYPGLATSRYRALVDKYLPRGAGAVFSFDCRGGRAAGQDFIRGVTLWSHLANVGDSKSLIIHPASTTHRQLERRRTARGRRGSRNDSALGRYEVERRSDLGPRAGIRARRRLGGNERSGTMSPRRSI